MLDRWFSIMGAETDIPAYLPTLLAQIVCHEAIKAQWNLPFNRFAWTIIRREDDSDNMMVEERTVRIGYLCSLLAKMLMGLPEESLEGLLSYHAFVPEALIAMAA